MSIILGKNTKYTFDGPYKVSMKAGSYQYDLDTLEDKSGVYAVFEHVLKDGKHFYWPIDIGESATVRTRIKGHDRHDQWEDACANDELYVAVHYTPNKQQAGRKEIEQELRKAHTPCCGDR